MDLKALVCTRTHSVVGIVKIQQVDLVHPCERLHLEQLHDFYLTESGSEVAIEDGCAYTAFADVALTNTQTIGTRMAVILHTVLYATAYKLWLALPADKRLTIM